MWFVLAVGMFHVIFFNSVPGLPELQEKYRTDGLIFIGLLFALDTIAILRFDFWQKIEKINFEQSMKDYRSLRDIWLERKISCRKNTYQPKTLSQSRMIARRGFTKNEPEETSSEE